MMPFSPLSTASTSCSDPFFYPLLPPLKPHPNITKSETGDEDCSTDQEMSLSEQDRLIKAQSMPRRSAPFILLVLITLFLLSGYFLRDYIQMVLIALENQNEFVIGILLIMLYIFVSLPFAWGYILVNVTTGYLYGVIKGMVVTVVTATIGVAIAHQLIKACLSTSIKRWLISSNSFADSLHNLLSSSESQAFKLIVLSRLTPVPFGFQNAFFAVNNTLSTNKYLLASIIGLMPCQLLNVYLGSTFRSMQQLLSSSETARMAILVLFLQVLVAIAVTWFVVRRAKKELDGTVNRDLVPLKSVITQL